MIWTRAVVNPDTGDRPAALRGDASATVSDTTLRDLVLARLEKDTGHEDEWAALLLAALEDADRGPTSPA